MKTKMENPFNGTPFWTQEGFSAPAPATAPATAPAASAPLADVSFGSLFEKKKQQFIKNVNFSKSPSTAAALTKKLTVKNINDEIGELLDTIDSLGEKDLGDMINVDVASADSNQDAGMSDLDTKKVTKQVNTAMTQLTSIFRVIMHKAALLARLGVKKTQSFMLSWNDNVHTACSKIAGALTNNNATEYEVRVFVDQTQKFCMALLVWVFVMNWYFVTFFVKEDQRYSFDPTHLRNFSITLYAVFGPSYRALHCFNWALVEVPSLARYTLSKMVIFLILLFLFTAMVSANFHSTIVTDFFNSMEGRYSTSVFCVFSIIIVIAYALWFVAKESGWHEWMNVFRNIPGTVAYFFIVLIYLIVVATVGIPLAMFFVSAFFVAYSFFGVFIYRGSDTFNTFARIADDISNLSEVVEGEFDSKTGTQPFDVLKMPTYVWNIFYRGLRVIHGYAFELILLFILLSGISKYRNALHNVISSKVQANQVFSKGGPLAQSFKSLFTWLLLINIALIIVIGITMVRKWNTIQMLKCSGPVMGNQSGTGYVTDLLKRAKNFVGENVTKLAKKSLGKTEEQMTEDKANESVLKQAQGNPDNVQLQREAEDLRQMQKEERSSSMRESAADIKQRYFTKDAWTPAFLKKQETTT